MFAETESKRTNGQEIAAKSANDILMKLGTSLGWGGGYGARSQGILVQRTPVVMLPDSDPECRILNPGGATGGGGAPLGRIAPFFQL